MKNLDSVLKRKIRAFVSKVAEKTVDKSVPIVIHELKVSDSLKNIASNSK